MEGDELATGTLHLLVLKELDVRGLLLFLLLFLLWLFFLFLLFLLGFLLLLYLLGLGLECVDLRRGRERVATQ